MTLAPVWGPLLVRTGAVALVVVAASLASERAGPFWGAILVALPISAGPAYVLLALHQDAAFIAASALTSLASFLATCLYLVVYVRAAPKHGMALSIGLSLAAWLCGVCIVRAISWTTMSAVTVDAIAFVIALYLTRGPLHLPTRVGTKARQWYDLPLRAGTVSVLVAAVVTLSGMLGPEVTGIAALFPIATTSLAVTVHPRIGGPATASVMASALRAMPGIAIGLLTLRLTAVPLGSTVALTLALLTSLGWPLAMVALRARRPERAL